MAEQGNSILNPSKFPIGRIRKVMKQDEDVKGQNIMQDALHMISIATVQSATDRYTTAS